MSPKKVVDLRTRLEAADPRVQRLVAKLPAAPEAQRRAARAIGLATVRRGLVTILAGCEPDPFGIKDERTFKNACALLETIGTGREKRLFELARSYFEEERATQLRNALGRRNPAALTPIERLLGLLPAMRSVLLGTRGPAQLAAHLRKPPQGSALASFAESARMDTGVRASELWEPILRDPECAALHPIAAMSVALERGEEGLRLLAEVMPSLAPPARREALLALNDRESDPPPPAQPGEWQGVLEAPRIYACEVDGAGDLVLEAEATGFDGLYTAAWLRVRLGQSVRDGAVTTNLTLAESSAEQRRWPHAQWEPATALAGSWVREALAALPAPEDPGVAAAIRLILREADRPPRECDARDTLDEPEIPATGVGDVELWRELLTWRFHAGWGFDRGDLAALGIAPVTDLDPRPQNGAPYDEWRAQEAIRRAACLPPAWVAQALASLASSAIVGRLARMLRYTALLLEASGRPRHSALCLRAADQLERDPARSPVAQAVLERSAFPDVHGKLPENEPLYDFEVRAHYRRLVPRSPRLQVRATFLALAMWTYARGNWLAEERPDPHRLRALALRVARLRDFAEGPISSLLETHLPPARVAELAGFLASHDS